MAVHNETGKFGEEFAALQLVKMGYGILARNFSTYYGELDIVAHKDDIIAFVEVRTRCTGSGSAVETVTKVKRKRLISAAYIYLEQHPSPFQPRFDIFAVTTEKGKLIAAGWDHLEGAFDGSDYDGNY